MASITLGRIACPVGCGHEAAQVKLKTDKEAGKTAFPYVHCAGCGIQLHTKNEEQAALLLKITRKEKVIDLPAAPEGGAKAPPVVAAPEVTPKPPAPAGGLFGGLFAGVPA
jgi:hypothetical protein